MPTSSSSPSAARHTTNVGGATLDLNTVFVRPGEATELPRFEMPAGQSLPETVYQIVHDEAMLDGNARLNLATFVSTWMDDEASRLYSETFDKNMIDKDEYPQTAAIEEVPAHPLADGMSDITVQRIVVRSGLNRDLAAALVKDIAGEVAFLDSLDAPMPRAGAGSHFIH